MAVVVSRDKPRLALFPSFLTPEEVAHLVNASLPSMAHSAVAAGTAGGEEVYAVDARRTSDSAWPARDDVVMQIEDRIHRLLAIPRQFGEELEVLRYRTGQKNQGHKGAASAAARSATLPTVLSVAMFPSFQIRCDRSLCCQC